MGENMIYYSYNPEQDRETVLKETMEKGDCYENQLDVSTEKTGAVV